MLMRLEPSSYTLFTDTGQQISRLRIKYFYKQQKYVVCYDESYLGKACGEMLPVGLPSSKPASFWERILFDTLDEAFTAAQKWYNEDNSQRLLQFQKL